MTTPPAAVMFFAPQSFRLGEQPAKLQFKPVQPAARAIGNIRLADIRPSDLAIHIEQHPRTR